MGREDRNEALSMLRPVETQRASEAIYEQIKDLILSGQLNPGDRLPSERNMMEMLQRSRPTIREALRMLERSGLIRTIPGTNGAIVQELNTSGVEQGDYHGFLPLDASFHGLLAKAGKNDVAYILTQVMSNLATPLILGAIRRQNGEENADMCRRILSMHRDIYEAVRLGNAEGAAEAMAHHIQVFNADLHD